MHAVIVGFSFAAGCFSFGMLANWGDRRRELRRQRRAERKAARLPDYRLGIAKLVAKRGKMAGIAEIDAAITRLFYTGKLTELQAMALKAHSGQLIGAAGRWTIRTIADEIISPSPAGIAAGLLLGQAARQNADP